MRIKCNYCVKYNKKIQEFLNHHHIAYKMVGDGKFVQKMMTFSVYTDESVYSELRKYTWQKPIMTKEFTKEELNSAAYLTLLPLEENVDIKNVEEAYQFECKYKTFFGTEKYNHMVQTGILKIGVSTKRKDIVFFTSEIGTSEIFISEKFCELIQMQNFSGIKYMQVLYSGKLAEELRLIQFLAEEVIPFSKICTEGEKVKTCPVCGKKQLLTKPDYQLRLSIPKNILKKDFYMTENIIGYGMARPIYFISQRLYQLFLQKNMVKNVKFQPVLFEEVNT